MLSCYHRLAQKALQNCVLTKSKDSPHIFENVQGQMKETFRTTCLVLGTKEYSEESQLEQPLLIITPWIDWESVSIIPWITLKMWAVIYISVAITQYSYCYYCLYITSPLLNDIFLFELGLVFISIFRVHDQKMVRQVFYLTWG